jgi:hypothetical protein
MCWLIRLAIANQEGPSSFPGEKRLAKRALCRMLRTSPAQVYRLLDQTCYSKTVDQMLRLLQVLGCTVKLEISQAT